MLLYSFLIFLFFSTFYRVVPCCFRIQSYSRQTESLIPTLLSSNVILYAHSVLSHFPLTTFSTWPLFTYWHLLLYLLGLYCLSHPLLSIHDFCPHFHLISGHSLNVFVPTSKHNCVSCEVFMGFVSWGILGLLYKCSRDIHISALELKGHFTAVSLLLRYYLFDLYISDYRSFLVTFVSMNFERISLEQSAMWIYLEGCAIN